MSYGLFDATNIAPQQGFDSHPLGMFDAQIANTAIVANKAQDGGMFVVTMQTQAGTIDKRYNLWFANMDEGKTKAVEIARKDLSALCHATGVFRINFDNQGAELRGARLKIEVAPQIDRQTKQPSQYVEVKKVFDMAGNEPGKAPAGAPQPQQQGQGGGWGQQPQPAQGTQQPPSGAPMMPQQGGGWGQQNGGAAPNPPQAQPQSQQGQVPQGVVPWGNQPPQQGAQVPQGQPTGNPPWAPNQGR